jgi:hypothetical protein
MCCVRHLYFFARLAHGVTAGLMMLESLGVQYLTIPYGVIRFAISALRVTPYRVCAPMGIMAAGVVPVVGQVIMIGGTIYTIYDGWKVIRPIYANTSDTDQGNKSGDALAGQGEYNQRELTPGRTRRGREQS